MLLQGNHAMQGVFPTPNNSMILTAICFSLQKVKAIIAPAVRAATNE